MASTYRSLTVKLEGQAVADGRVSVRLLAKTLDGIQAAAYEIGRARLARDPGAWALKPSVVDRACELFLTRTEPGSLTAVLELPTQGNALFSDLPPTLGEEVLADVKEVLDSMSTDDPAHLSEVLPDPAHRRRVVSTIAKLLPDEKSDYSMSVGFDQEAQALQITRPDPDKLCRLVDADEPPKRNTERAEALYEGKFIADSNPDGTPGKIRSILAFELIEEEDIRPYRTAEVDWEGRRFIFSEEIACSVSKHEHLVVLEFEPLDIRICAPTRADAIRDFAEEFAFLWDEYVMADDLELTQDAVALKHRIQKLAKEATAR